MRTGLKSGREVQWDTGFPENFMKQRKRFIVASEISEYLQEFELEFMIIFVPQIFARFVSEACFEASLGS